MAAIGWAPVARLVAPHVPTRFFENGEKRTKCMNDDQYHPRNQVPLYPAPITKLLAKNGTMYLAVG